MRCPRPSGPVRSGSVDPKIETVGTRSKAARCIVPVSLVSNRSQLRSSSINSSRVVCPIRLTHFSLSAFATFAPTAASLVVPKRIHCTGNREAISCATSAKRGHRFAGPYSAPGQRANLSGSRRPLIGLAAGNCGFAFAPIVLANSRYL